MTSRFTLLKWNEQLLIFNSAVFCVYVNTMSTFAVLIFMYTRAALEPGHVVPKLEVVVTVQPQSKGVKRTAFEVNAFSLRCDQFQFQSEI